MRIGDIYPGFQTTRSDTLPTTQSPGVAATANAAAAGKKGANSLYIKIAIVGLVGILIAAKYFEK
jgi:hypothetical protein